MVDINIKDDSKDGYWQTISVILVFALIAALCGLFALSIQNASMADRCNEFIAENYGDVTAPVTMDHLTGLANLTKDINISGIS